MKINFKLLGTFLAVADHASFRKAAEQQNLSLPAVSMQVKQLEERLGVALFQRTTRRVELTREGEQLLVSARKAMAEIDGALAQLQQAAQVQQGHLAFACVPTVAGSRLPALLVDFAAQYPGISVGVRELALPDLLEAVRRREADFGIGPQPEKKGELEFAPLFEDAYVALVPASSPAAAKASITLRELARLRLLTLAGTTQLHHQLQAALQAQGLSPERNYEFSHASTQVAMAEAGLGVAVLPAVAVPAGTPLKTLRIVRPAMSRTIAVITVRGHTLSPAAARFVALCGALAP